MDYDLVLLPGQLQNLNTRSAPEHLTSNDMGDTAVHFSHEFKYPEKVLGDIIPAETI